MPDAGDAAKTQSGPVFTKSQQKRFNPALDFFRDTRRGHCLIFFAANNETLNLSFCNFQKTCGFRVHRLQIQRKRNYFPIAICPRKVGFTKYNYACFSRWAQREKTFPKIITSGVVTSCVWIFIAIALVGISYIYIIYVYVHTRASCGILIVAAEYSITRHVFELKNKVRARVRRLSNKTNERARFLSARLSVSEKSGFFMSRKRGF